MTEVLWEAAESSVEDQTTFVRELAASEPGGLELFLPNRQIEGVKSKHTRVSRVTTAALARSFDAETPIGKRPVAARTEEVGLVPIGQKLPLRETELLHAWLADQNDSDTVTRVADRIYDDQANNVAAITNRVEQLRGEFLSTGRIEFDENGLILEADFGLPGDHNLGVVDLDSGAWDNGGDWLTDYANFVAKVKEDSGEAPFAGIISSRIRSALLTNPTTVAAIGALTGRVTVAQLNQLVTDQDLPPFVVYDGTVGGVRNTPDDKVIVVTRTVGETQWGVTAEEIRLLGSRLVEEASQHQPRIIASATTDFDPVAVWSKANSTVLPVAGDINGLLVAQVLTAGS